MHLAHKQDETYPLAGVVAELDQLTGVGFPVTVIERNGTHYDDSNDALRTGTDWDLVHQLLPYLDAGWRSP